MKLETPLVKAAIEFLRYKGYVCWRQNVAAVTATYKGKTRFIRFGVPGVSDIIGCSPEGRFLAAEAKVGHNKTSPAQTAFLASVHEAGGIAVVFWNLDDLADGIRHGCQKTSR